jgi:probable HAF family extracellular repeat protein
MKSRFATCIASFIVFAALIVALHLSAQEHQLQKDHVRYIVTDLGPTKNFAEGINDKGWVSGSEILADGTQHAFLRRRGVKTDLGTFGGPNSSAFNRPSERGLVAGNAETSTPDPLGEDFCGYGTHLVCLGFIWHNGVMTLLATLGGNNSWANGGMNNRGEVVGMAENATLDPTCATPGLEAKPVLWERGNVHEFPTFPGDEDGTALSVNDRGQAVGASTDCNASPTIFHAVLWQDGTVTDLGSLGGTFNNVAQGINNRGTVVGFSDLPGDTNSHAFLWTEHGGMRDLGTFGGLPASLAFGINNEEQVVGMSCDTNGDCGAFLWQDGVMTDLNRLLPKGSPWNVIVATSINALREIVGVGDTGGGFHAVLLTPCDEEHASTNDCQSGGAAIEDATRVKTQTPTTRNRSAGVRRLLQQRFGIRYQLLAR